MLLKVGKKDKTSVHSWRLIALLLYIAKGLKQIVAKWVAQTALTSSILSPQYRGALLKRSTMDLVAAFTYNVEAAITQGKQVTIITMDV